MARRPSPYPNLERYLLSVRVAEGIYAAKRPENWLLWAGIPATYWAMTYGWFGLIALYGVIVLPLSIWLTSRRRRSEVARSGNLFPTALPAMYRRLLRRGVLSATIGELGAAALERCARHAVAVQTDMATVVLFVSGPKAHLPLRKEISDALVASMDHALVCFVPAITGPGLNRPVDLNKVAESENELQRLGTEVAAWAASIQSKSVHPDLTPIREQLRAMREMELGFQSGEIVLGDGDLEKRARERE
ncbi:MAG: hypothetical protein ACYC96_06550 [Fimbriimonadaceae bacterium]